MGIRSRLRVGVSAVVESLGNDCRQAFRLLRVRRTACVINASHVVFLIPVCLGLAHLNIISGCVNWSDLNCAGAGRLFRSLGGPLVQRTHVN